MSEWPTGEPLFVVCSSVADGPASVATSTQDHCGGCGAKVWVAPSSRLPGAQYRCLTCAGPILEKVKEVELAPGGLEEIAEHLKP